MMRIRDFSGETAHWEAWRWSRSRVAVRSKCPLALETTEEADDSR